MRGLYSKIHVGLLALGLGVAGAYFWNGMSVAWSDVAIELPKANAEVLPVFPSVRESDRKLRYMCDEESDPASHSTCIDRIVFQGRDLRSYNSGGVMGCGIERQTVAADTCEAAYKQARDFVWRHWTQRKSGYIAVRHFSVESGREWITHLFIETNGEGKRRIVERTIPMLSPEDAGELRLGELIQVEWEKTTDEDEKRGDGKRGTQVLRLTDIVGNSLIL